MLYPKRKKLISFRLGVLVLIGASLDLSSPILSRLTHFWSQKLHSRTMKFS